MRIAILAPYVRNADAVGLQLIEWTRLLARRGHEVSLFVEQIGPDVPQDVLARTRIVLPTDLPAGDAWRYIAAADVVICDYPAYYALADCLRLLSGPSIVFSYHGVTPAEHWPTLDGREFLERSRRRAGLVHFADLAIARSAFTRHELHELTGFAEGRIGVVPCVVHSRTTRHSRKRPDRPSPLVLSVGRVAAHKRPELLVEALALVRRRIPEAQLVLAGDARGSSHAPVVAHIRKRADELGLLHAVHITGAVGASLLDDLYSRAALFATASAHEGFCVPVVEAMARGVPVVAMATGALPETVADAGILVADGDVEELAAMAIDLLDDRQRDELVARGYVRAARFRPEVVGEELGRLIEALPGQQIRRPGLPRLGQQIDLHALDLAAELGALPAAAGRRIPLLSAVAVRVRRWLTSDLELRHVRLVEEQVAFNRRVAQAARTIDELSAAISEAHAAVRHHD